MLAVDNRILSAQRHPCDNRGGAMRLRAVVTLLALAVLGLAALRASMPHAAPAAPDGARDVTTFAAIVERLRAGEPYYAAYGDELRRHDYPTRQAFNWRTPLLLTSLATTPPAVAHGVLLALGVLLCMATLVALQPLTVALSAGIMQLGAVVTIAVPAAVYLGEAWAGVLIALSVCAYVVRRPGAGVALGVLALFTREIAIAYCVVCTLTAVAGRRWREVSAWAAGAIIYGAYYGWHLTHVINARLPDDLAHTSSWLQFGGLRFLMTAAHWHGWLLALPLPFTALAVVLVAAGMASVRAPIHVRLTSAAYAAFFLVAGQRFNDYWGLIAWPTWALAFGYGVQLVADSIAVSITAKRTPSRAIYNSQA